MQGGMMVGPGGGGMMGGGGGMGLSGPGGMVQNRPPGPGGMGGPGPGGLGGPGPSMMGGGPTGGQIQPQGSFKGALPSAAGAKQNPPNQGQPHIQAPGISFRSLVLFFLSFTFFSHLGLADQNQYE